MNLKTLRELKGISRKELAELTGVSFRSIQDYEQGHKDLSSAKADTILKMAKALDCSMEDLISDLDLSSVKPSELESHAPKNVRSDDEALDKEDTRAHDYLPEITVSDTVSKDLHHYILMHKDDKVAELIFEPASGALVSVMEVYTETLLPIGTKGPDELLKGWWHRRAVPVTQGNILCILERIGFMTPQAYLLRNLGLSLTDDYWVKPSGEALSWRDVSLFANEFDDVIGAGHFAGFNGDFDFRNLEIRFPSGSTRGNVPKSWICMEDRRYLVKGVEKGNTQQIFNEVVGAFIHRRQNKFEFVDYQFYTIDYGHGKQLGVSAEAFTNEDLEFVSAQELIRANRRIHRGASDYELFVDACVAGGLDRGEVQAFLDYQIMSDFVITNTDRNYENFGVLRDANTLEFVKMAPIFDSGNSMFYDLNMSHGTLELNNIPVNSFAENEAGLIKLVKDPSILDLDKLLTNEELSQVLASSNRTPEEIRILVKIYERKKDMLFKLKRGDVNWLKGV
ncbi:putative transcriptional regulator [Lachnospiraceae bacterium JC7]|nr:putative transcriptional regulator [Lachnospiraceae bacterium JC7]